MQHVGESVSPLRRSKWMIGHSPDRFTESAQYANRNADQSQYKIPLELAIRFVVNTKFQTQIFLGPP